LRSEGKCYSVSNDTENNYNNFIYLNCPSDSPTSIYLYNIQFSARPGVGTVGYMTLFISSSPFLTDTADPLNMVNLKSNLGVTVDKTICGTNGGGPTSGSNAIMTLTTNGAAQSQTIDLQEERIQIEPGNCLFINYGALGGTVITDTSIRFHI
jgi:hypothetical protein